MHPYAFRICISIFGRVLLLTADIFFTFVAYKEDIFEVSPINISRRNRKIEIQKPICHFSRV